MIIEHIVQGSKQTSFHDFNVSTYNMILSISKGSYYRAGVKIFNGDTVANITIPIQTELTNYEVWLTSNGLSILTRTENENFAYDQLINQIDRLAWFDVPTNCTNLNNTDIHFVKVVE
jgi:hypothetical protein